MKVELTVKIFNSILILVLFNSQYKEALVLY